jgi:glycosyltransferase involved in cell wall biosynthesis
MSKKFKFKIITPSYNNEDWVEYNIASILNQTYINYEVLYIDDASTDSTYEKVIEIVGELSNWKVIKNEVNKGATVNYFLGLEHFLDNDEDIVVHLDGDDWFIDETVLEKLNTFYNEQDCWMSYGGFIAWYGDDNLELPRSQSTPYSDFVHEHKLYRRDDWRASHLRTFKTFLLKALNTDDLKSLIDKKYYWHASDLAFQFPYLEMCPKEKIGVVDFYTHVYNQAGSNLARTHERETSDNTKYEVEIRNRKRYKEGLNGEKLPQVNVIGDFRERNSIPKDFTFVYNVLGGEYDITLIQDMDCMRFIEGAVQVGDCKVVADLHEPPHLNQHQVVYDAVYDNADKFDLILTYDEKLLTLPNAVFRNGGGEVVLNKSVHKQHYPMLSDDNLFSIYPKTKVVSFITSNKTFTEGHRFRVSCVEELRRSGVSVDVYGVGYSEIFGKIEGLKDYAFSVAIENGQHKNYFTEKILDCFLTGTVPIYNGCTNLGEYFDMDGVITFNNQAELVEIISNLTEEDYKKRQQSIQKNYELALTYRYDNDIMFNKYLKQLIK